MISPVCQPAQVEVKAILRIASLATAHDPPYRIEHPRELSTRRESLSVKGERNSGSKLSAHEEDPLVAVDMVTIDCCTMESIQDDFGFILG